MGDATDAAVVARHLPRSSRARRYFRSFASALEDPEVHAHELHALPGGRVIALGVERGRARSTGTSFEARFVHLWNVHEGGVSAMQGLIDTAAIQSAFA